MSTHRLDEGQLRTLRHRLSRSATLLQPLPDTDGEWRWLPASDDAPLPRAGTLPLFSAKTLLFSERESLFVFDGTCFRETLPPPVRLVLFGASACDLAAIHYQDRFFADDPWYRQRRNGLLRVGIDCNDPCSGGFCPMTASGPFVRGPHADLVLNAAADHWRLFVLTEAGAEAIAGLALPPAALKREAFRTSHEPGVAARFPPAPLVARGIRSIDAVATDAAFWAPLGNACIGCSGCTTACPTCSCHATVQEPAGSETGTATVRIWDSCLYAHFQQEASGHNPAAAAGDRVARYWTHKFGKDFVARFGHYTCTGCGRCDRVCPSGIGAHSVMRLVGQRMEGDHP